jgi:T5SS/PEP-CTERM-associated repeat protein
VCEATSATSKLQCCGTVYLHNESTKNMPTFNLESHLADARTKSIEAKGVMSRTFSRTLRCLCNSDCNLSSGRTLNKVLLLLATTMPFVSSAKAQTFWTNPDFGSWTDANNWDDGVIPNQNWDARIDNGGEAFLLADAGATRVFTLGSIPNSSGKLVVMDGGILQSLGSIIGSALGSTGMATVEGTGSTWENTVELIVGGEGAGWLNIQFGGMVSSQRGLIGYFDFGAVTVRNNGAWHVSNDLQVGIFGTGILDILDGSEVYSTAGVIGYTPSSNGTVTVDGDSARWTAGTALEIGSFGTGTLNIRNGGVVSSGSTYIGYAQGAVGTATVAGGSFWATGDLHVGHDGAGTLNIGGASQVSTSNSYLGTDAGAQGSVTVTGTGSWWTHQYDCIVGNLGAGMMTIEAGASVATGGAYLGYGAGSTGEVRVTGPGSSWFTGTDINSRTLSVGKSGMGTLTIDDGATVSANDPFGTTWIGESVDSLGVVTVSDAGSTWTSNYLNIGGAGIGGLYVRNGASASSTNCWIGVNMGSTGIVVVNGPGSSLTNSGDIFVGGAGFGTLSINNGAMLSNSHAIVGNGINTIVTRPFVTVSGLGSTWTNAENLTIGNLGFASLNVLEGGMVTNQNAMISVAETSESVVTVAGSGSTWASSGKLVVGDAGNATLTIENGGVVSSSSDPFDQDIDMPAAVIAAKAGAIGAATVRGAGSTWTMNGAVMVGDTGHGTLVIENGGTVVTENDANTVIGREVGATGAVVVSGSGSSWTVGALVIGEEGDGSLLVENGGSARSEAVTIGGHLFGPTGNATVTGAGSIWTLDGNMVVGDLSNGSLSILDGGAIVSDEVSIGLNPAREGFVTVSGPGSTWTISDAFRMGQAGGDADLHIENGAAVTSSRGVIAESFGSDSLVTVAGNGARWSISGNLAVGGNDENATAGGDGHLDANTGGRVEIGGTVTLFPNGRIRLQGGTLDAGAIAFQGAGQFHMTSGTLHVDFFHGNLTNVGGALAPGNSAGSTTILGNYTQQAAADLEIEIGGALVASQYDFVNVTGTTLLGGELQLSLINGFIPSASQVFTVFNSNSLLGFFSNVTDGQRLTTADGSGSFLVHYGPTSIFNPNQIRLSDFQLDFLPGDFNRDNTVDAADYVAWRKTGGTPAGFESWRTGFGATAIGVGHSVGRGSSLVSAPEPGSATLLLLGFALTCYGRRRKGVQWGAFADEHFETGNETVSGGMKRCQEPISNLLADQSAHRWLVQLIDSNNEG